MNSRFGDNFGGAAMLVALLILILIFLAMSVHRKEATGMQVTMDRARECLQSTLNDVQTMENPSAVAPRQFKYFTVLPCTNTTAVGGTNYPCVFYCDFSGYSEPGRLEITTNQVLIWHYYSTRPAKIITADYAVSAWQWQIRY